MSEKGQITKNFFWLLTAELSGKVFQFLYIKILSSVLGPENFGIFSWSQANIAYFLIFVGMGLDTFGTREVSRDKEARSNFASSITTLRFLLSIAVFSIMLIYIFALDKSMMTKMALTASGIMLFANSLLIDWVYLGLEQMRIVAIRAFGINFLNFIGIWLFIKNENDVVLSVIVIGVSQLINSLFLIFHFIKYNGNIKFKIDSKEWKYYFKEAIPIGMSMIMITVFNNSDILMIGFLWEDYEKESALLYSAVRMVTFSAIPAQMLLKVFFPVLSKKYKDEDRSKDLGRYHLLSITIGLFLFQFLYFFASDLILIQFNEDYLDAVVLLMVLSPRIFFIYLNMNLSAPLLAWGFQKKVMYVLTLAAVINIILNYIFIPEHGAMGAIIATLITELVTMVYYYYLIYKLERDLFAINFIKAIIIMIMSAGSSYLLSITMLPSIVSLIFNIFVFAGLVILFNVISIKDIKELVKR